MTSKVYIVQENTGENRILGVFDNLAAAQEFVSIQLPTKRLDFGEQSRFQSAESMGGDLEVWNGYYVRIMPVRSQFVASKAQKDLCRFHAEAMRDRGDAKRTLENA